MSDEPDGDVDQHDSSIMRLSNGHQASALASPPRFAHGRRTTKGQVHEFED